jgi:hypothetical protein
MIDNHPPTFFMSQDKYTNASKLTVSFDVGHSSIGWSVLRPVARSNRKGDVESPDILGTGAVVFGADDCLASKRRLYRRQRRHTRSTRQRIARMETLLAHLGVMSAEELRAKHRAGAGHPAPWLLAARVLASNGNKKHLLTWPELWDVLRWYAHNRGYDGNARWSSVPEDQLSAAEQEEKKGDTEKEKNAVALMERYGANTMAETMFADLFAGEENRDPLQVTALPFLQRRFKANQCAFPRSMVFNEVSRILSAHVLGELPKCNEQLKRILLAEQIEPDERVILERAGIRLHRRFEGGLLFGQLVPRFDNRIIGTCPITGGKVPNKHSLEFLEFRWAMTLANIQIGFGNETYGEEKLRPLNPEERHKIDAGVRKLGFLKVEPDKAGKDGFIRAGKNELRDIVQTQTRCDRSNLESLLLHPDAKDSLKLVPVQGSAEAFRAVWSAFGDPVWDDQKKIYRDDKWRRRFTLLLLRGKELSPFEVACTVGQLGDCELEQRIHASVRAACTDKKGKINEQKAKEFSHKKFSAAKLKGRARFARHKLVEAAQQVFHPQKPVHPLEKGGCLEQTDAVKEAALKVPLDEQTNNHLVRHRLTMLKRLFEHLVTDYADGDKRRVGRIIIEVARDLQTMSGMTNKEKAKELGGKIGQHREVAAWLAEKLETEKDEKGRPFPISAGLIRKARIAADLDWTDPYTGKQFEPVDLVHRTYDKDHIIPRSSRLSDALEAIVITKSEINREKGARTALQFIRDMNLPENQTKKVELGIRTEAGFREFVDKLKTRGHPDDARRRERRKKFLLTEKWEDKDFTPGDLTKTAHITKLGKQQLEAQFLDLPIHERPPVIPITGAVTAAFRDKSWKLLPELRDAQPEVARLLAEKKKAEEEGRDFNLKKAVREVTHLHHALDATALALIAEKVIPPGHQSLNGDLVRFIVKEKLTDAEFKQFETLAYQFSLPRFWFRHPRYGLQVVDLDEGTRKQIRERLAERRVVQHIPADMSGLRVEENTRGVVKVENGRVYLRQRKRDEKTGKLKVSRTEEAVPKALGLNPTGEGSLLAQIKGVRVIQDNFGVAILDHADKKEDKFVIIPHHKVWHRIQELRSRNAGKWPRILRIGSLIRIPKKAGRSDYRGVWMIRGAQINQNKGFLVDLSSPDAIEYRVSGRDDCYQNVRLQALVDGGLEVLRCGLTGIAACRTTSSA